MPERTELIKATVVTLNRDGTWVQVCISVPEKMVALYLMDGYTYGKSLILAALQTGELAREGVYKHMILTDNAAPVFYHMVDLP